MVDIESFREAYNVNYIANFGLILSEYNYANPLTKLKGNKSLPNLLTTHLIDHPVEHFIQPEKTIIFQALSDLKLVSDI